MMSAQLQASASPAGAGSASASSQQQSSSTAAATSPAANLAGTSKSPYILSQKDSSILWQLFDNGAVQRAKAENKLIFLHVGYSASHFCSLTIQESFTNRAVIQTLNNHFMPIIVDREERPDLDTIYMSYIHSLNSAAGYPLNVFLTPDLQPVFGGTYFPAPGAQSTDVITDVADDNPEAPDFLTVLLRMRSAWDDNNERIRLYSDGRSSLEVLRKFMSEGTLGPNDPRGPAQSGRVELGELDLDHIEEAYEHMSKTFDYTYGGFLHMPNTTPSFLSGRVDVAQLGQTFEYIKKTPRFTTPSKLSFLLNANLFPQAVKDVVGGDLCHKATDFGIQTLLSIISGGIRDHVGGGIHHYSKTRDWSLPSFEKILSDNALLLGVFLDAWTGFKTGPGSVMPEQPVLNEFGGMVLELADYLTTAPILLENGGLATSEAADSRNRRGDQTMRNGAYYLWTRKEFDAVLGDERQSAVAAAYWNVKEHGNVDSSDDPHDEYLNQNVLCVVKTLPDLSAQFSISQEQAASLVASARSKLRAHREKERIRPSLDAKVVAAYNGMAIACLSRAGKACREHGLGSSERGARYLKVAKDAATFIKKELWDPYTGTLYRMYHAGIRADTKAFAEDYAFLIQGLLELSQATTDDSWLEWVQQLQQAQLQLFYDYPLQGSSERRAGCGGFYSTSEDASYILLRVKDAMDTTQPSTNAVSTSNLIRLSSLLKKSSSDSEQEHPYLLMAKETINAFEPEMLQYPYLFPGLLSLVIHLRLGTSDRSTQPE
ncbi:spermidine N(1)-acetyltransferase [Apiospora phragmitis]|uniref:Spermidine N(1)-acetyltransferase n=1 Tax=Apiospora phragmitis TaxID=2905665 RepID=A0ABR1URV5_9PEZI